MENLYQKHRDALRTWNEFVKVSRSRGVSDSQIAEKLRASNVEPEVISLLLEPTDSYQRRAALSKKGKWKIAVGIVKIVLGIAGIVIGLAGGPGLFMGIIFVVTGIMWIGSYVNQD